MSNIIRVTFNNKNELTKAYIKHFKYGGIFIAGNLNYTYGEEIFLIVGLPEGSEPIAVSGKIDWLSPASAVGYPPGIGVHFNFERAGQDAKSKIEIMLGGLLQNSNFESNTF